MRALFMLVISFAVASWIMTSLRSTEVSGIDQLIAIFLLAVVIFFPTDGLCYWVSNEARETKNDIRDIVVIWGASVIIFTIWVMLRFH